MVTFPTPLAPNSGVSPKGSLGFSFKSCIFAEDSSQRSFCPWAPGIISVDSELRFGYDRYRFDRVPPQSNSQSANVCNLPDRPAPKGRGGVGQPAPNKGDQQHSIALENPKFLSRCFKSGNPDGRLPSTLHQELRVAIAN